MAQFLLGLALAAGGVLILVLVQRLVARRHFTRAVGRFVCKPRVVEGSVPGMPRSWQGRRCEAQWVHEVLMLRRGTVAPRTVAVPVRFPEGVIEAATSSPARPVTGNAEVRLRLRLDDGALLTVSAHVLAREALAGPYLAVAASSLPPGATERWTR